jgi:nitrogen fixation protein FixH
MISSAAQSQPLPLLHRMEERAGERRSFTRLPLTPPLSSVLSPLLRRGERKEKSRLGIVVQQSANIQHCSMKTPRSFWPLGIIAAFVLFIAGIATMMVLACRSNGDLVSRDYYEQEIRYQSHMDALKRTQDLSSKAGIAYEAASDSVRITLPPEHARAGTRGRIELYRPSAAGLDRTFQLQLDSTGVQTLDAANLRDGLWKVKVFWAFGGQEFSADQNVVVRPKHS